MKLESVRVNGFRRFGSSQETKLRVDSSLVCLVGANEVGKSTLLDAMELFEQEKKQSGRFPPIPSNEWTRGDDDLAPDRNVVSLRFRLSEEEQDLLESLPSGKRLQDVRWLERHIRANGSVLTELSPTPLRDKAPRRQLASAIRRAMRATSGPLGKSARVAGSPNASKVLEAMTKDLESNAYYIKLGPIKRLADFLEDKKALPKLVSRLRAVHEIESLKHPHDEGREELAPLVPHFVRFRSADRRVEDAYDLDVVAANPPSALANLAALAGLDLVALNGHMGKGNTGAISDAIESANEMLKQAFSSWSQKPPVKVSFDTGDTDLLIHVKSGKGASMKPTERSEGLRQFVALVALTTGEEHRVPPILLIDEADMHLHYDAQADLVRVLSEQTTAAQVIYTTHSAACLPDDLGAGVRVVRGVGDEMRSYVDQQFWTDDPGLVPLLLGMGAGGLAFVPLRPAVIVEGGSDLVLLPSLLCEASGEQALGYQVVPGAAGAPPTRVAGLDLHGIKTSWVLDGDKGGRDRRKYLVKQLVPAERIHLLESAGSGVDLEDLVRPATYVEAVNKYAKDVGAQAEFTAQDLPKAKCHRHKAVAAWCKKHGVGDPSKAAIANKVLELRGERPLCDPAHKKDLRRLHNALRGQLVD